MNENHDFKFKLAVWDRIQKGTATQEDHDLAFQWADEHYAESLATSQPCEKWMMQQGERILQAWPFPPPDGQSDFPSEQILLFAIMYGNSDIENGGFEQFFSNQTGGFAPETADGLDLINFTAASRVLRDAMSLFGAVYPRDQIARRSLLQPVSAQLSSLTDLYYELFPPDKEFNSACEKLLAKSMG